MSLNRKDIKLGTLVGVLNLEKNIMNFRERKT